MAKHHTHGRQPAPHRRSWLPFIIALLAVLMVGLVLFNLRPRATRTGSINPNDAGQVALGKQIYTSSCAACHGANLEGQPDWQAELPTGGRLAPPHDPSGHTWHHPDAVLFNITKDGGQASSPASYKNNMPGFAATLSDAEIWATLSYIKSTWPPDIRQTHDQINQQRR